MFTILKRQVRANFDKMAEEGRLFYVKIDRDIIWDKYLENFSEEEKQGHNCNCCKSFLRQYSGVVTYVDNKRISVWDNIDIPELFKKSIEAIQDYIHSLPTTDIFLVEFQNCGTDKNMDRELGVEWEHFYFRAPKKYVKKRDIAKLLGDGRTNRDMYVRAVEEITEDAVDTVLELIGQGSLYRGKEFKSIIEQFKVERDYYATLTDEGKEAYGWTRSQTANIAVVRVRNSAIGTLLVNLSESMDLDTAVTKWERVMAPSNYKRTTALATPKMISNAKAKLTELGLLDSLGRRYAIATDVPIENLLFIDKGSIGMDPFDDITKDAQQIVNPKSLKKVEEITIEKFISDVLPTIKSLEVLLENHHLPKFVNLLVGENKDAPTLFKWSNTFGWNYTGGITDSIKERVKAAGGQVTGELRVSLSWFNYDDLDIWVTTPGGNTIKYNNKVDSLTNGKLDVDMNAGGGESRSAVENIIFPYKKDMKEGIYTVTVNNFQLRERDNAGYDVQIEHNGDITNIHSQSSPRNKESHIVVKIKYSKSEGISFDRDLESKVAVKQKWGLSTNKFIKVKQMMLSPNYWDNNTIGNKHYMFMLEDCVSDEQAKPFFNEFLNGTFTENRKVFETLSSKMVVPAEPNQLSGIGFSETMASEITLRVVGQFQRLLKIKF